MSMVVYFVRKRIFGAGVFLALLMASLLSNAWSATVTWQGGNMTWNQPDSNSFGSSTYQSGDTVLFTGSGLGSITVGSGVTPGPITFNHTSGTYMFSGTAWNAGTNPLTINGSGTVQMGNMTNTSYTATWGPTDISGGGTLNYTRGLGYIGRTGATITVNDGTLRVGANNTATYVYNNPIAVGANGARIASQFTNVATIFRFTGSFTGTGNLTLQNVGSSNNHRGSPGLRIDGNNGGFSGAVNIVSTATEPGQFGQGMVTFESSSSLFANASSVTTRDGGILGFSYSVGAPDLANVTAGRRGGLGATGAGGTLTALSSPMSYVGIGGVLVLDNFSELNNNRIGDAATIALQNARFHIIGHSANNNLTQEAIGAMTFTGSSWLTFDRPNNTNSGVWLTASSLSNASPGNTLLISNSNPGTTISLNRLAVTGSKPASSNGMITPGIQMYGRGATVGNFTRFDANNNLLTAVYNSTNINTAVATNVVNVTSAQTLNSNKTVHALRLTQTLSFTSGTTTLTLGSGGLIMGDTSIGSPTVRGVLNFGSVPAFIGAYHTGSQATIHSVITGSGGVTFMGTSQTVNLTGSNTFTGGLFINGGTVNLSSPNAANNNDTTVNVFGRLTTSQPAGAGAVIGGLSGDGRVAAYFAGTGASELVIAPASGVHTFNGTVRDGDGGMTLKIVKSGLGTQVFGPDSVGTFTGGLAVEEGTLAIHGNFSVATGPVTVATGARLSGRGIIGGSVSHSTASVLAPGASIGELTFNSALDLSNGAILEYDLGVPTAAGVTYDHIVVIGTLTGAQAAGALQFKFIGQSGFELGTPYKLFSFTSASGLDPDRFAITELPPGASPDPGFGTSGWLVTSDALYIQFIPEPATVSMLLIAGGVILLRRRVERMKSKAASRVQNLRRPWRTTRVPRARRLGRTAPNKRLRHGRRRWR